MLAGLRGGGRVRECAGGALPKVVRGEAIGMGGMRWGSVFQHLLEGGEALRQVGGRVVGVGRARQLRGAWRIGVG